MAGKKGRSGRPIAARQENIKELLDRFFTLEMREKVLRKLIEMAIEGNMEAVKQLYGYTYGKPMDNVQHHGGIEISVTYANKP